ncbi:MAG: response regulator, partial [Gammaproteobacteria bacterium]|nr:response regulator [Gammaproteobacteria bacterium]
MPNTSIHPDNRSIEEKLADLHASFQQRLPSKISEIRHAWEHAQKNNNAAETLIHLHRMAHSIAGSAGTFGAVAVGTKARELEHLLKSVTEDHQPLSTELITDIERLVTEIQHQAEQSTTTTAPYLNSNELAHQNKPFNNLIFLVEDDELLAQELSAKLECLDYKVRHFLNIRNFVSHQGTDIPAAILMDMVFDEGATAGADAIHQVQQKIYPHPPVIFISVRTDIEARLAAARAGAIRYFSKPLAIDKLIQTLDGLTARVVTQPFRVLLIDNDKELLEYYVAVMENAGMQVVSLTDPMRGLDILQEFKPDLVLLDVYMPGCSGPELAQVIRQDDDYAQMPIMFLSTEYNLDRQLAAMNLGGDDFLTKPVEADHLIAAVTARVKRARWTNRLTLDLKDTLRESEYRRVALDQHAIVSITDTNGNISFANDKFCEISGFTHKELLGQNHRIVKSNIQDMSVYEQLWQTISQGRIWHGELCNRSKTGNYYWINITIVPFLNEHGLPYQYVAISTDITALKQAKDRLALSHKFAHIGNWDWNIKTGEVYWSKTVYKMLGLNKKVIHPDLKTLISLVYPDDREKLQQAIDNCLYNNTEYNVEIRF